MREQDDDEGFFILSCELELGELVYRLSLWRLLPL